jgi:hypothetical protein
VLAVCAVAVPLAIFGVGCAKKPTMHLNHAEVSGVRIGIPLQISVVMTIAVDVTNPNSYDVAVRAVRGSVLLANRYTLPVNWQPGGEGVWLTSKQVTQVRVPVAVPVGLAAALLTESMTSTQIPFRFQGKADVTATRTFALEKDDYSVDEQGFVSRQQIEAAVRGF